LPILGDAKFEWFANPIRKSKFVFQTIDRMLYRTKFKLPIKQIVDFLHSQFFFAILLEMKFAFRLINSNGRQITG
jgi:hypothetical protein